jgi:hypothetical protein
MAAICDAETNPPEQSNVVPGVLYSLAHHGSERWAAIEQALTAPRHHYQGGRPRGTGRFRDRAAFVAEVRQVILALQSEYNLAYTAKGAVADGLGVSRRTLGRALKRWGLAWPPIVVAALGLMRHVDVVLSGLLA